MKKGKILRIEFVILMASLMSIVAFSVDAILPAIPRINQTISITSINESQRLITILFLGLGCGQLLFGPLSDSFGRKPMVYAGFIVFIIASIICINATSLEIMLFGRLLQGIGLSSPRSLALSIIRDCYDGDYMAKIISTVVMFFILVPVIAPTLGQWILQLYNWQSIFYFNLIFGFLVMLWFGFRQNETLPKAKRVRFSASLFINGTIEFVKHKKAVAYTIISGFITGTFMVYLSTSQHIFQAQYNLGDLFPYVFASLAIAVGLSTFLNSRYVVKFGTWRIAFTAIIAYCIISMLYVILFSSGKNPNIGIVLFFFVLQFSVVGFLFGNLRALAMQPLGHIAGIGAAINGFVSTVMAVPIAEFVGSYVTTSVLPLFMGFLVFGLLSLSIFLILKKQHTSLAN